MISKNNTHQKARKGWMVCSLIAAATLLLNGCSSAQKTPEPTAMPSVVITVAGSGGATTVLEFLADAYHAEHAEITFKYLEGSGSGGAVTGVVEGVLDLGTMSRAPKDSELAKGIKFLAFASDRVVIATSPDMSLTGLTSAQVKDIFLGKITNWSEVGGPDAAINVLVRDEDESSTQVLRKSLFGNEAFTTGAVVFTSEGELRKALAGTMNTIAFLSYGGMRLTDTDVHTLAIDGIDPANIDSNYPYSRVLGVAYLPSNAAKIQAFLDFLAGEDAHTLLAGEGINHPE
jgi:phosphate transport system substrate-binding protein